MATLLGMDGTEATLEVNLRRGESETCRAAVIRRDARIIGTAMRSHGFFLIGSAFWSGARSCKVETVAKWCVTGRYGRAQCRRFLSHGRRDARRALDFKVWDGGGRE